MKRLLLFALLLCGHAFAQQGNTLTLYHAGAPTGSCGPLMLYVNATTGDLYSCVSGAWHLVSGGGSSPLTTKGDLFGFSTVNARVPVGSDGLCLKADSSNGLGVSYSACAGAATGYQTIQNAAAAITQRTILNWTAGIVCADNAGATRSDCALANVSAVSHKFFNAVVLGALSAAEPASTDLADFSTTAPAANGKIPIYDTSAPNAAGGTGAYVPGDPLVQGTQAAGSTTIPNPVVIGGSDFGGTPAVRIAKVDSSGNLFVGNFPASQPVTGTFWQATQPVSGTFWQATQPVSGTFWQATQPTSIADGSDTTLGAKADAKSTATDTTAISAMSVLKQISASVQAPPSQAVTNAGTFAVQAATTIADGADVTLGAKGDAKSTATDTTAVSAISVLKEISALEQAPASRAVTNAGTFADQATLQTQTDTVMVGGVNVKEINGVAPLMGNGGTGTGSQRVTIASDNTAFAVNAAATLAAETTKVIGTVRAQGNLGAAFDAATGAAVPANAVMGGLKDTAGNTQDALADTNGRQFFKQYPDTTTTSYRASKKFAASSTTDNAVMPGNATNTVLVTKILLTCNQTTAGQINVELLKRSTADTSGTSAAMTAIPMDSNYAAAVSAPLSYTGTGPTVGTAIGDLDNLQIGCMASATATPNDIFIFHPDKPIVLRGTAQQIAVNVGNAALTGGNITVTFEWEETTTP